MRDVVAELVVLGRSAWPATSCWKERAGVLVVRVEGVGDRERVQEAYPPRSRERLRGRDAAFVLVVVVVKGVRGGVGVVRASRFMRHQLRGRQAQGG